MTDYPQNVTLSNMTDYPQTITITKDEYYRLTNAYNDRYNSLVEKFALAILSNHLLCPGGTKMEDVIINAERATNALLAAEENRKESK